ncbi:MAG: flippase [Candidatus Brocadiia bacterium]
MRTDVVHTFGTRIVTFIISAVASIILVRFLGAEGRGVLGVILMTVGILTILADFGITFANVYFTTREKPSVLFWNSLSSGIFIGLILIGVAKIIILVIPSAFRGIEHHLLLLCAISLPFILVTTYFSGIIRGLQEIKALNIFSFLNTIFILLAYIIILSYYPTVRTVILIILASNVFLFLMHSIYLSRKVSVGNPVLDFKVLGKSISFGVKGYLGNVLQFFNYRIDVLIANWFCGPRYVGFYVVSVAVAESLWHLGNSVSSVLFPYVSACRDDRENARITTIYSRVTFYLTLLMALIIAFISPYLITLLFGSDFSESILPFLLLLPGVVIFSFTTVIASYLAGVGLPHYNTIVAAVSFVVTIILDVILIPRWGINGAAIATSISYITATVVIILLYKKQTKISLGEIILPKISDFLSLRSVFKR